MTRQLFEYHSTFGYRFIPDLKARVEHESGGYLLRTNSSGFRCEHNFDGERCSNTHRALLFGDSFTAGDGVSNKNRYGDKLEEMIKNLEVWNFGLSGTGTDQQFLIYDELAQNIDCDVIIIGVLVENIRRVAARFRHFELTSGEEQLLCKPYFTLVDGELIVHQIPVPQEPVDEKSLPVDQIDQNGRMPWLRLLVNSLGPIPKQIVQKVTGYDPVPAYNMVDDADWQLMSAILQRWIERCRQPVILVPIPLYQHVEKTANPDSYRARFRELAALTGAVLHDPLDDLWSFSHQERRKFRFKEDIHLTSAGHLALAESLAPIIRSTLSAKKS